MRSINKVILIGNVTRDPEMRQTQSGQKVCTFGIATNREWVTSDGRKQSSAEYHEVVAWAQLAEICEKYVRKGKLLYVEGYLKTRSWDTPEGIRKFKTEVVIQDMIMLEKRKDGEGGFETYSADADDLPGDEDFGSAPETEEASDETPAKEEATAETEEPAKEEAEEAPAEAPDDEEDDDKNIIDEDLGL